jgi:hypothetical protein
MSKKPKPSGGKRESQTRPGEPKREPFDDIAKAFYRRWFEGRDITVETEREVFARGRAIDLVVCCTGADLARLQDTIFAHFRRLNDLELKGVHDPLTLPGLNLILMRAWGLGAWEAEEADEAGEVKQMKPVLTEDTWKAIDEFFWQTPEAPEKLTSWQEVIAESERRATLQGEQRGALRTQQQTLIRLLRHKFPEAPDSLVRRIEATEDPERLSGWLDPLLDASTLAEVEQILEVTRE